MRKVIGAILVIVGATILLFTNPPLGIVIWGLLLYETV